jgi:hypothetical protein
VAEIISAVEGLRDGKAGPLLNALSSARLAGTDKLTAV